MTSVMINGIQPIVKIEIIVGFVTKRYFIYRNRIGIAVRYKVKYPRITPRLSFRALITVDIVKNPKIYGNVGDKNISGPDTFPAIFATPIKAIKTKINSDPNICFCDNFKAPKVIVNTCNVIGIGPKGILICVLTIISTLYKAIMTKSLVFIINTKFS